MQVVMNCGSVGMDTMITLQFGDFAMNMCARWKRFRQCSIEPI